jgi:hypothetical protein
MLMIYALFTSILLMIYLMIYLYPSWLEIYALLAWTLIAYLVLGTAQLRAIAAGLKARNVTLVRAWLLALLLAYVPVIGSAAGVYGAAAGWQWTVQKGIFRFFGPLLIIAATYFVA